MSLVFNRASDPPRIRRRHPNRFNFQKTNSTWTIQGTLWWRFGSKTPCYSECWKSGPNLGFIGKASKIMSKTLPPAKSRRIRRHQKFKAQRYRQLFYTLFQPQSSYLMILQSEKALISSTYKRWLIVVGKKIAIELYRWSFQRNNRGSFFYSALWHELLPIQDHLILLSEHSFFSKYTMSLCHRVYG